MTEADLLVGGVWTQIPGQPGYWLGMDGAVVSLRAKKPRKLVGTKCGQMGYRAIHFPNNTKRYIHHMVCEAWRGPRPTPRHEVRHLNGNNSDNRLVNLAWGTHRENEADKVTHGTTVGGAKNGNAKLTETQVQAMRQMRSDTGLSYRLIGQNFNVTTMTAWRAIEGKSWK